MRRTKEEAALTRDAILRSAEDLFVEHGFDGVSLDQIAERAGVKRGAVHFHFVNKLGLLIAIAEVRCSLLQGIDLRVEHAIGPSVIDGLAAVLEETLRSFHADDRQKRLIRILLEVGSQLQDEGRPEMLDYERRLFRATRAVLESASERGELSPAWTPRSGAVALHCLMTGFIMSWARGVREVKLVPDGVEVMRRFLDGMRAPAPAAKATRPRRRSLVAT